MQNFSKEYRTLSYVVSKGKRFLLFAHNRPDPDTLGANAALYFYLKSLDKEVDVACFNEFPEKVQSLFSLPLKNAEDIDLEHYDVIIAADSVDRGFHLLRDQVHEDQVVVLIDHHPDITLTGDIVMIDPAYSSASEIVYRFFDATGVRIDTPIATALLTGILFDTGGFQHSSVKAEVLSIGARLMQAGAPLEKISKALYAKQDIPAMRLWGIAFDKVKFIETEGLLVTAITQEEIIECGARPDDTYELANVLCSVPQARYALVLTEKEAGLVRGSLRAMKDSGVDVSALAHQFGGGGHALASGFEVPGKIMETKEGFYIE